MKKLLILTITVLSLSMTAQAQKSSEGPAPAKAMFFELGGPGLASINYDMRFTRSEKGIGGRIGLGGFSLDGDGAVFIPIGLNYLLGKDNKNYFELGAGVTPVFGTGDVSSDLSTTFGHLNFGYRRAPKEGGFFFRAAVNPIFGKGFFWTYYGGVAFGYKF